MTRVEQEFDRMVQQLKQTRDELALKIHLGTMDARQEWDELERKWADFERRAELDRTAREIGEAAGQLVAELKEGYQRLRKVL